MVREGASLGETPHCGGANVWGNRARQTFPGSVFSAEVTKVQERRIPCLLGGGGWGGAEETAEGEGSRGLAQFSPRSGEHPSLTGNPGERMHLVS